MYYLAITLSGFITTYDHDKQVIVYRGLCGVAMNQLKRFNTLCFVV